MTKTIISTVLTVFLLASCIAREGGDTKCPKSEKAKMNQYQVILSLIYTTDKLTNAISDNSDTVKRQCFVKYYSSQEAWVKCVKEAVMAERIWIMGIVPVIKKKIETVYKKVEVGKDQTQELTDLVCGLRRSLPKFKKYSKDTYEEATKGLSQLAVTCTPPKEAPAKTSPSKDATPAK